MVEDVISNAVVSNGLRFDRVSILHRLRPCALISSLGKICQGTAEKIFDARDRVTSGASDGGATDGKPGACDASPSACIVNPNVEIGAAPRTSLR